MKKQKRIALFALASVLLVSAVAGLYWYKHRRVITNPNPKYQIGQVIDSFNDVPVHYNGSIGNVTGRNTTEDGYNLGLKYQCVEFVKRYYFEYFNHKMPNSYGNAKDFFDHALKDGEYNPKRDLTQYTNTSISKPMISDLLIFDGHLGNRYGHVAIISKVGDDEIEIVQQNAGPFSSTRATYPLNYKNERWTIERDNTLGWLRKAKTND